jgi:hypothetical protein
VTDASLVRFMFFWLFSEMEPVQYGPDSYHYKGWVQAQELEVQQIFDELHNCEYWQSRIVSHMTYRANELQRTKFFLVDDPNEPPERIPKYSYPGFQYAAMEHYHSVSCVPAVEKLLRILQQQCNGTFNHSGGTMTKRRTSNKILGFQFSHLGQLGPSVSATVRATSSGRFKWMRGTAYTRKGIE